MTKTADEVIAQAHRYIQVLSVDEDPSTDQVAFGTTTLEGLLGEAETRHGVTLGWTSATVPDGVFLSLSRLLASEIAGHYGVAGEPLSRAWGRFRAAVNADDRADWRDLDEDGTVEDAEADAALRSEYY